GPFSFVTSRPLPVCWLNMDSKPPSGTSGVRPMLVGALSAWRVSGAEGWLATTAGLYSGSGACVLGAAFVWGVVVWPGGGVAGFDSAAGLLSVFFATDTSSDAAAGACGRMMD